MRGLIAERTLLGEQGSSLNEYQGVILTYSEIDKQRANTAMADVHS
jgi:hypothetical protein